LLEYSGQREGLAWVSARGEAVMAAPETIGERVKAIGDYRDCFERRISGKDVF